MRKSSLFLVAAMLLFAGSIFANDVKSEDNPRKKLSTQIAELLRDNSIVVQGEEVATVLFTLNEEKEIVVLSVKTDSGKLEQFVKGRLNYQKVTLEDYREGRTYSLPVRVSE